MSCCGGKRAQLSYERVTQAPPPSPAERGQPIAPPRDEKTRTFEYVGHGTLTLHGAVSGRTYQFMRRGERVEVEYMDAFAMMAERDVELKLEKRKKF
jgi:hypothetical protein